MQEYERNQKPDPPRNEFIVGVDGNNDGTHSLPLDQQEAIDAGSPLVTEAIPRLISFDRYEYIGLLLMMYGWWKLLEHSWTFAILLFGIGWLLAFATGDKRDGFIRIVEGISKDILNALRSLVQKTTKYLDEKRKSGSDKHGDGAQ